MITPLATQLTYAGLIDELYGIRNGVAQLDADVVAPKKKKDGEDDSSR